MSNMVAFTVTASHRQGQLLSVSEDSRNNPYNFDIVIQHRFLLAGQPLASDRHTGSDNARRDVRGIA